MFSLYVFIFINGMSGEYSFPLKSDDIMINPTDLRRGSIDKIAPKLGLSFETAKLFMEKFEKSAKITDRMPVLRIYMPEFRKKGMQENERKPLRLPV